MTLTIDPNAPTQQMIMSPTSFLQGAGSPRFSTFVTSDED
jgi:serine/threonine protein kinase